MSDKDLIPVNQNVLIQRELTPSIVQMAVQLAPLIYRFFMVTQEGALGTMLKGYELGLSLMASFEFIFPIEGRVTLSPRGHLALLHRSGLFDGPDGFIRVEQQFGKSGAYEGCAVSMRRSDSGFEHQVLFTLEDAQRAGLIKPKSAWEAYPQNMCQWRAIGYCADVVAPDIGGGLKRADEFTDRITHEGDVVLLDPDPLPLDAGSPPLVVEEGEEDGDVMVALQELLQSGVDPDLILKLNNGVMPTTAGEVAQIRLRASKASEGYFE